MENIARRGILLITGAIGVSAALSIPNVQSWAEDEKLSLPQKLTGRDAANALIGNTVVGYVGADAESEQEDQKLIAFYLAPDGAVWVPPTQTEPAGLTQKWSIDGNQLCITLVQSPSLPNCLQLEVEGMRVSVNFNDDDHHVKWMMWMLPGNAFNFPKGTIQATD
jgi:hypothetical protein